jgi:rhodanese-related sulfurtransferase
MPSGRLTSLSLILATTLALPVAAWADTVKGRVDGISFKASTIRLIADDQAVTVMFAPETQFVNAANIDDLAPPDLIEVEFRPGKPATRVTKVIFNLPAGAEVSLDQLEAIRAGKTPYVLVDARPAKQFATGHIPGSINIYPKDLPSRLDQLPADKGTLVIFYCGGPTCPYTAQSIEIAQKAGYTNLKGFQAGIPAWKKADKPVVASPEWVAANLGPHHLVVDVRAKDEVAKGHVKGAVSLEPTELTTLTQKLQAEKKPVRLPGVSDMMAPIVVYGDTDSGDDVLRAYAEMKKYKYKNAAILKGGYREWAKLGLPTGSGPATAEISYVKRLKPGAVPREEFASLVASRGDAILLDVREAKEVEGGMLPGALHVSLDRLQVDPSVLPKDRPVLVYCANGIRAEMAYDFLKKSGYDKARFLDDTVVVGKDGRFHFE